MFHYIVINKLDESIIALDSTKIDGFQGYDTPEKAYMSGLAAKIKNRLSDFYIVYVI